MKSKKILIGIAAVALLALLIANVYAQDCCLSPGLTPGFWKHNVGVYLGLKNGAYSDPTGATEVTKDTMGAWLAALDSANGGPLNMQQYYDALSYIGGGAYGAMIRNDAANEFNWRAGLELL